MSDKCAACGCELDQDNMMLSVASPGKDTWGMCMSCFIQGIQLAAKMAMDHIGEPTEMIKPEPEKPKMDDTVHCGKCGHGQWILRSEAWEAVCSKCGAAGTGPKMEHLIRDSIKEMQKPEPEKPLPDTGTVTCDKCGGDQMRWLPECPGYECANCNPLREPDMPLPCPFCGVEPERLAEGEVYCATTGCPVSHSVCHDVGRWNRRAKV